MTAAIAERAAIPMTLLAAAGFLSSAGARIIDPLLDVIAGDFHVSVPTVSVIVAAFTLPYGLNQLLLGPIGDRFGKLRVMMAALVGYALATAGCAMASSLSALTVMRMMAGASSAGLIPVCLAYIGDSVPYEDRQVTLSRFLTGVVLAQMLAGPVGGLFGQSLGWRGVFLLLSCAGFAAAALLAARIGALPDRRRSGATFRAAPYLALARHPGARRLLLATLVEGALMAGSFPFLAPYLHDLFGLSYLQVGLMLSCFGLGAFAYTRGVRPLLERFGEAGLVLLGAAIMAAAILLASASHAWQVFPLVEALAGLGYFMLHAVLQARATELLPELRATAVSSFVFMLFLGQGAGALAMGLGIAALGYRGAFQVQAAGIVLLGMYLAALMRRPMR